MHRPHRLQAFALPLVLITLGFAIAMMVLFLSGVGHERRSVNSYSRENETHRLADVAVNLVISQISTATKEGSAAAPISWASQPGMIRTYNTTGALSKAYKLYSWDNLVELGANGFDPTASTELPSSTWDSSPAFFTDLNQPLDGVYPIVDGTTANITSGGVTAQTSAVPWDFPGVFAIDTSNASYKAAPSNKLPMPVKWLYVLQDGSYVAPTGASGSSAKIEGASATNPIVGRIAFWTDDETAKVNVNTASEGAFWDTPKCATADELQFAGNPPVKGEFNRVSGHPATTSLSAVFPEMRQTSFNRWNGASYVQQMGNLLDLTPRISGSSASKTYGGSQSGIYPIQSYSATYPPANAAWIDPSGYSPISLDADRLYPSADELWFQPQVSGSVRSPNTAFGNAGLTAKNLSQRLFFLTANSRAPETTLFETPRISLWPITWPYANASFYNPLNTQFSKRPGTAPATLSPVGTPLSSLAGSKTFPNLFITPQELLLAYCSSLNANAFSKGSEWRYYFQRQNSASPTWDWNNIPRNQEVCQYIRRLLDQKIPGFGASLKSKWGSDNTDWITLNCFDFARSQINQYTYNPDPSANGNLLYSFTGVGGEYAKINNSANFRYWEPNAFASTPMRVSLNGNGPYITEGAYPTLNEAAIMFYATSRREPQAPASTTKTAYAGEWANLITYDGATGHSQTKSMKAVMFFNFAMMHPQVTRFSPVFWIKVTPVSGAFTANGTSLNFPGSNGSSVQYSTLFPAGYPAWYPASFCAPLFNGARTAAKTFSRTSGSQYWTLISDDITVDPDATSFLFNGGKIRVDLYACDASGKLDTDPTGNEDLRVSTQVIDFSAWNGSLPIPLAPRWNVRQSTTVSMPDVTDPRVGGKEADNVTVTPDPPKGWQIEVVPDIPNIASFSTQSITLDPRSGNSMNITSVGAAAGYPLMYAYKDAGGNLISTNLQNRVLALGNGTTFQAEGTSGTTGDLFATQQNNTGPQGWTMITTYDTVISMVADPGTTGVAGDPRVMGHGKDDTGSGTTPFIPSNSSKLLAKPAQVIGNVPGVKNRADNNKAGPNATITWATKSAQYHELGYPGPLPLTTGLRYSPVFGTTPAYASGDFGTSPIAIRGQGSQSSAGAALGGRDRIDQIVGVEANATLTINPSWDWTTMPGNAADGGYVARPDQEYESLVQDTQDASGQTVPFFQRYGSSSIASGNSSSGVAGNTFIPNRQVPSPVILGTLPTDMQTGWQTLTFCPNPAKTMNGSGTHPGPGVSSTPSATGAPYSTLPDHLLLDLFWMPVAEPYPISDNFSTAGKVNLNYAMMPFPYIQRKTGLDAVLKSVWMTALPAGPAGTSSTNSFTALYKSYGLLASNNIETTHTRYPINVQETLKAFDYKFQQGDIFRAASQICDMFLYPNNPNTSNTPLVSESSLGSASAITQWWKNQQLTGDNAREDPYSAIYSRVTTKSNTYTVHWRVQVLNKSPGTDPSTWTEGRDHAAAELRGSTLIERYLDSNTTLTDDYATSSSAAPLSQFYKWRIVSENFFHP